MSELSVKAIIGIVTAAVGAISGIGALLLWGSANMVFAGDLDKRMEKEITPIYGQLQQIRNENLENKILDLTSEIAVLEYNKENDSNWSGADEVKLVTLRKQREQLEEKLKEKE